jgi:nonribosomal peptide synthetase DhbF
VTMETDPTAAAVLAVLRDVIGTDAIAPEDDFYLVGGHSLMILTIARRLKAEHDVVLDPRQIGRNSQVAAIIAACRPAGVA